MASKSFQSFGMVDDSNVNKRAAVVLCRFSGGDVVGAGLQALDLGGGQRWVLGWIAGVGFCMGRASNQSP